MKIAFEIWIEDGAELTAFAATVVTEKDGKTAVSIVNLKPDELKGIDGYLFKEGAILPVKDGEA